jgi:hypothetical protein
MSTLTGFVPSAWTRYYVSGWVMIYLMYLQFTFNALLLIYQLISSVRLSLYKFRFALWKRKHAKLAVPQSREDQLSEVSEYLRKYDDPNYLHKQALAKQKTQKLAMAG